MKFTNVKQLIIKFMGGGLINFPTRFLRWVKINGDIEGDDDGGGDDSGGGSESDSNIFFQLASIQPNRFAIFDDDVPIVDDIKNLNIDTLLDNEDIQLFYSKEELTKFGISLEELEGLECFTGEPIPTENNFIQIDGSIIRDNFIITYLQPGIDDSGVTNIDVNRMSYDAGDNYYIMRFAYGDNNNYLIIPYSMN